ncbi:MAG TPA: hypothetical protein VKD72_19235, partial [Gemmataceae bacterium]|nr:hypothetical protein [Gemmataceae bacterium]
VSFPPAFNQGGIGGGYMGDYDQAVADNGFFYTTWGDNRLGDAFHAHQPDVRLAKIPVSGMEDPEPAGRASPFAAARSAASPSPGEGAELLGTEPAQPLLAEAVTPRRTAGADTAFLHGLDARLAGLGRVTFGLASGHTDRLDASAAGWGGFMGQEPRDGSEFASPGNQGVQCHMHLLTVLLSEMGNLLGHDHDADRLMAQALTAGTRREPGSDARLGDWTVSLPSIDVPIDALAGSDPTCPWNCRRK